MDDNKRKAELLNRYKKELAKLKAKTSSYPKLVDFTVAFAIDNGLSGSDMQPVIPQDMLECCIPTVLDMIDATEEYIVE